MAPPKWTRRSIPASSRAVRAVDGERFSYRVQARNAHATRRRSASVPGTTPARFSFANEVVSTQDERAPIGSLVLAGGKTFVRTLDVPATVNATDLGGAASGPGYVAFGGFERRGGCGSLAGCAEPLGTGHHGPAGAGADGPRTVEARVYDSARGPAEDPGRRRSGRRRGTCRSRSRPRSSSTGRRRTSPCGSRPFASPWACRCRSTPPGRSTAPDSGVQPASGVWTFGDDGRAEGLVASHAYTRTGRFALGFSVADQAGNVARITPVDHRGRRRPGAARAADGRHASAGAETGGGRPTAAHPDDGGAQPAQRADDGRVPRVRARPRARRGAPAAPAPRAKARFAVAAARCRSPRHRVARCVDEETRALRDRARRP